MSDARPVLGLVGGTGLNQFSGDVRELEIDTPYGAPSAAVQVIDHDAMQILFMPRHGSPHRIPPHRVNYRANIWALREAGAARIMGVYAVGGIGPAYGPGVLAAADQLIDYTWGREHTYSDSEDVELVHVDFSYPYAGPLREALLKASKSSSVNVIDGGCIGVFQGPRLESAAEVEKARRDGCDMAGMTALPEAALARELGID